jgi:hypothetical protein
VPLLGLSPPAFLPVYFYSSRAGGGGEAHVRHVSCWLGLLWMMLEMVDTSAEEDREGMPCRQACVHRQHEGPLDWLGPGWAGQVCTA